MQKCALMLATTAAILGCGTLAASAQSSSPQTGTQQSPTIQATPGGSAIRQNDQVVRDVNPLKDTESLTIQATPGDSTKQDQVIRNVEPLEDEDD